jgi:beta-mannosidase
MSGQLRLLAICAFVMFSTVAPLAQMTTQRHDISLNSGWEFRQLSAGDSSAEWRPAQVPGDVHLDLLRNKLIPDPYNRDNEAKLQWIENADWEYRTSIQATPDMLSHKNIDLVFEGLDAYAKVYLNEQLVLTADNMFREWRVNVKPVLKAGANQLHIVFPSPIKTAVEIAATDKWREQTHTGYGQNLEPPHCAARCNSDRRPPGCPGRSHRDRRPHRKSHSGLRTCRTQDRGLASG